MLVFMIGESLGLIYEELIFFFFFQNSYKQTWIMNSSFNEKLLDGFEMLKNEFFVFFISGIKLHVKLSFYA